jgi:hypothetical protein
MLEERNMRRNYSRLEKQEKGHEDEEKKGRRKKQCGD